ncbi:hypothetical protein V6N13_045684 [Hibiscus sabdariffa]
MGVLLKLKSATSSSNDHWTSNGERSNKSSNTTERSSELQNLSAFIQHQENIHLLQPSRVIQRAAQPICIHPTPTKHPFTSAKVPKPGPTDCPLVSGSVKFNNSALF